METFVQQLISVTSTHIGIELLTTTANKSIMEPTSTLLLVAIILLGIAVMGGGTMAFCCHGWERGLPFISIREIYEELGNLEESTTERFKTFVILINEVSADLQRQVKEIPYRQLVKDRSVSIDLEAALPETSDAACQNTSYMIVAPAPETVINIPDE